MHNGVPADSPPSVSPSKFESNHKRHLSGSTLSSRAAAALEKAEEKYDSTKSKIMSKSKHFGKDKDLAETEERGRTPTRDTLTIENPLERPASLRSLRNGEPLVLHGWTLTTPVGFRAVCKSIRETAFEKSPLPIIVSLEVHADLEQQETMVDIMKEEWKGLLIDEAHEACNPDERLPNLEELLHKILIKVKKAASDKQDPVSGATLVPIPSQNDGDSGSDDERSSTKKKVKICESLSNLGIYTHSEHFVSFEAKSAKLPPHVFSIGESQILELHENKQAEMFLHNRDFFMRAYPAGFRIDSSNLDPSGFWRKGVQMVALNWQKLDEGMMLNEGMFTGEQGWVLKPPGYRSDPSEHIEYKTLDLKITFYAGQHIPIPPGQAEHGFHPYVRCELHVEKPAEGAGDPVDSRGKEVEYKQKTSYCKGDHPDFGGDGVVLSFPQITSVVEQLSFVRYVEFVLHDALLSRLPPLPPFSHILFHGHTDEGFCVLLPHRSETQRLGSNDPSFHLSKYLFSDVCAVAQRRGPVRAGVYCLFLMIRLVEQVLPCDTFRGRIVFPFFVSLHNHVCLF